MLTSIRKYSKSFFIKILVGIIILPFLFWGMGDVFRGGNQNIIATIDSEKISAQDFVNYLRKINLSDQEQKSIKKSNLLNRILAEYAGRKIIELEIKDFNIFMTDASLKEIITSDKTFFKNKKFSRTVYEKFLLESAVTAPVFEQNIAAQEKKRQLLSFLSAGSRIPQFLIENEYKKENQLKTIKYLDLNDFYKKKAPKKEEVKKIYEENKDIFAENYKSITFVELLPDNLTGKKVYDKNFFDKIDKIENKILDDEKLEKIALDNNLSLLKTGDLNSLKFNSSGVKYNKIDDKIFKKFFEIRNINQAKIINLKDKYYLVEISSSKKINKKFEDPAVQKAIINQLEFRVKLENNTKIVREISEKKFDFKKMEKFAKTNQIQIRSTELKDINDNTIFTKDLIKRIFETSKGDINLITDSRLSKNFIIFTENTVYKNLNINSKKYEEYKSKAKLSFTREIYAIYDKGVNSKYKVELNDKVINRVKNSF